MTRKKREPERFSCSDLWLAAMLHSQRKKLVDVQVNKQGRFSVFFTFQGENISPTVESYCKEEATANVTSLRSSMNHLRDLIFQAKSKH